MSTDATFELDLSGASGADDLRIGGFESVKDGTYHVGVTDVEFNPTKADHSYIENALFKLSLEIFAGDPATEVGKKFSTIFFRPDAGAEKWKFENATNLLARLGMATLVIPANSFGQRVAPDFPAMVGKHFVIEMRRGKEKEPGKEGFLNVRGIWHVASPEVQRFLNPSIAEEFPMGADTLARSTNGGGAPAGANGNGNGSAPAAKPPAPIAPASALANL